MRFVAEVVAKVEAGKMEPGAPSQFTVQARLHVEHEDMPGSNEPQLIALVMPESLWQAVRVGDVLHFPLKFDPREHI